FPPADQISEVLQHVGSQHLELDHALQTIRFLQSGIELNLGSVGKGYALDRCAEILTAAKVDDFLVHGGQSSILARGSRYAQPDTPEWRIAVRHPLRPERRLAELKLCNCSVGTSGSGQQFFYHQGRRYGHVLDPRTGVPAEGVLSVTVLAPHAAEADALATAFFVLGVDATHAFCTARSDLAALFVLPGTRAGTVRLESIGLGEELVVLED
ncbi:MAG: FAD:protein FMN transferase, partial [Pirellulaceae bacterium]